MEKTGISLKKRNHNVITRLIRDLEEKPTYSAPFDRNVTFTKKERWTLLVRQYFNAIYCSV